MTSGGKKTTTKRGPRRRSRLVMPRSCPSCDARLASDQKGRLCSACEKSERGLGDDQEVIDFTLGLYPLRQKLGPLGLDYIFFHHFFNQDLKDELAQLRRTLYRQPEPPRPLSLGDAAAWAARTEKGDTRPQRQSYGLALGQLIAETFLAMHTAGLLLDAIDEPKWAKSLQQNAGAVSQRLQELENQLPAAIGTLHLALVCGTPPLPPGVRASSELRPVPQVGFVPVFCLNVFSAKERDVKTAYEAILGGHFNFTKKDFVPLTSRWRSSGPLQILEIACVPYGGCVPTPATVQRFFMKARRPVARFFDGTIKAREYGYALRAWAMLLLIEKRKMAHREALTFWNEQTPDGLHYQFSAADRKTQTGESVLSQELRRLRRRIKRWQAG